MINAYSPLLIGTHEVRLELVDNSADTAEGKPEYERTMMLSTEYVITIIVSLEIEAGELTEEAIQDI